MEIRDIVRHAFFQQAAVGKQRHRGAGGGEIRVELRLTALADAVKELADDKKITAAVTRSMLEPKLLGKHLGLDPLVTLMALYIGYRLWGVGGMLLAPMLTVVLLQLVHRPEEHGRH